MLYNNIAGNDLKIESNSDAGNHHYQPYKIPAAGLVPNQSKVGDVIPS